MKLLVKSSILLCVLTAGVYTGCDTENLHEMNINPQAEEEEVDHGILLMEKIFIYHCFGILKKIPVSYLV